MLRLDSHDKNKAPSTLSKPFRSGPVHGLGAMKGFPLELLTAIVRELDLPSCINLSQVNRYARQVVCSVPEFRTVATHASDFSLLLRRMGQGGRLSIAEIDCLLKQQECRECGKFAPFVYVPGTARCCLRCVGNVGNWPSNDVASLSRLARALQISRTRLRRLVLVMRTDRKPYTHRHTRPVNLVSIQRAIDVLSSDSGDLDPHIVSCARNAALKDTWWPDMSTTALPCLYQKTGNLLPVLSCRGCQEARDMGDFSFDVYDINQTFYHSPQTFLEHSAS